MLSVSRLVRVSVNLSPLAAARRSFGTLLVAGDSDVIDPDERLRSYLTYEGVLADFGVDAPESQAAALYYGQTPKPRALMVGRWVRSATPGMNEGGILSSAQQAIALWSAISNGGVVIPIDGANVTLSALDFSAATNLNAVAAVIDAALGSDGACEWNGSNFVISSGTTGAGAKSTGTITLDDNPSYGARAAATVTLTGNPANGNTVVIQGTTVTFVTGTPTGNQVLIGADAAATAANLQAFLQASADTNLALMLYNTIGAVTTITARDYGTGGNSYTLTKVGANISVSGAVFSGGVAADTLTVNGTALTFVAASPGTNEILVGPTAAATSANIQAFLAASSDSNIDQATYSTDGQVTTVEFAETGTDGDAFTLAKSSANISLSGASLTGGADTSTVGYATAGGGTDISEMLKMTSTLSQDLVDGYNVETPAECAAILANKSAAWYGLMFQASTQPTDGQNIAVADVIEALDLKRIFGVTITNTNVLSSSVTTDLASLLKAGLYRQSFCQYSQNAYAIASLFGRAFSVNFAGNRQTITLMYKQEPGVTGEDLTETQADTLKAKRCNVFVDYVNDTVIVQYGVMSGLAYIDEVHGLDWLQDAIQNNCFNALYQSKTKIPQTDAGVNQLTNAVSKACEEGVNNGLVGPGIWNTDGFGELENGQYLKTGYYVYAQPIDLQSQSDREARVAPPIQAAVKLAGAIQELDVIVDVNR